MELDDVKDAWTNVGQTAGDVSLDESIARLRRLRHVIFWRDAREIVAAAIAALVFASFGWLMQAHAAPLAARLSVVLILASLLFIVAMLLWARHPRASAGLSVGENLRAELTYIDRQIWIVQHAAWWYVGPVFVGGNLLVAALRGPRSMFAIGYFVLTLSGSVLLVWLNRRGARMLRPVRDAVLRDLESVQEPQTQRME
jgi:hypothetical protein